MERPQIGIAVAVIKDGKVALGKRLKPVGYGTYQLPGGHLEMYDTFEQRAKDEVREETGLEIEGLTLLHIKNNPWPEHNAHYVTLFYGARWKSGELHVPEDEKDKVESWNWYEFEREERGDFQSKDPKKFSDRVISLLPTPLFEMDKETLRLIKNFAAQKSREDEQRLKDDTVNYIRSAIDANNGIEVKWYGWKTLNISVWGYNKPSLGDVMKSLEGIGAKRNGKREPYGSFDYKLDVPHHGEITLKVSDYEGYEGCVN